jgi:hypothetical protein
MSEVHPSTKNQQGEKNVDFDQYKSLSEHIQRNASPVRACTGHINIKEEQIRYLSEY